MKFQIFLWQFEPNSKFHSPQKYVFTKFYCNLDILNWHWHCILASEDSLQPGATFKKLDIWDFAFQRICSALIVLMRVDLHPPPMCFSLKYLCQQNQEFCTLARPRLRWVVNLILFLLQLGFQWKLKTKYEQNRILHWEKYVLFVVLPVKSEDVYMMSTVNSSPTFI